MTQIEAIKCLEKIMNHSIPEEESNLCSGNAKTCYDEECMLCSVRDCPYNEPLHYHHDGCPACYQDDKP